MSSQWWSLALWVATGVGAAIAADAAVRSRQGGSRTIGLLGLAAALWAGAELWLLGASGAGEILWGRRILFAAVCAIGPLLSLVALDFHGRRVRRIGLPMVAAAATVEAICYALLYTPRPDLFISGRPGEQLYGPAFYVHGAVAWLTLAAGIVGIAAAAWRTRGSGRWAAVAAVAGAGTPLVLNWIYVATGWPGNDPTPLAVAVAGIALRFGAVELLGRDFLAAHARALVLDQVPAGVLVADAHGRVIESNAAARALAPKCARGDALAATLAPFLDDPGYFVHTFPLERRGARIGEAAVIMDRREARALRSQALVENHLRAIGIVAAGLAHEINNPLAAIVGNLEMLEPLLLRLPAGADAVEASAIAREVEAGLERIRRVVSRMARLATPVAELGGQAVCDVERVVQLAASLARLGKPTPIVEVAAGPQAFAHARASEVLEILFHLLQNAVQASPDGECVDVRVAADAAEITVSVADRGPGLPADVAELFSPFFTTQRPGRLGLGLSLSWELARKNGGRLAACDRAGGGAEFFLRLPAAAEAASGES